MPRIPSAGRSPDSDVADVDKMLNMYKAARERSGANIGPRQPISEEMKQRINADMDKMGIGGKKTSGGGSGGTGVSDTREMQLGSELDPKAMMKREDKKAKGGKVSSASSRADGIAQRGKTRGKMC